MQKLILYLAVFGVMLELSTIPAHATALSVTLTSSTQSADFVSTGTSSSLALRLGACTATDPISGACTGTLLSGTSTGGSYSITTTGNLALSGSAATGMWSVTGTLGTMTVGTFSGTLNSLSFSESPSDTTGLVFMTGSASNLTTTVNFSAMIQLAGTGSNINTLATSLKGTDFSGPVVAPQVPEPSSIFLFGSGLVAIGGALRRRRRVAPSERA